jgi:hypothetical protein
MDQIELPQVGPIFQGIQGAAPMELERVARLMPHIPPDHIEPGIVVPICRHPCPTVQVQHTH